VTERRHPRAVPLNEDDRQSSARRAYNLLREGIRDGSIRRGDRLVEDELTKSLATSRNAVREALRMLTDEGLISRERRFGTIVVRGLMDVDLSPLLSTDHAKWDGVPQLETQVERVERRTVPSTPHLRSSLKTDDAELVMVEDLVRVGKTATTLRVGYFPIEDEQDLPAWSGDVPREHWWVLPDHASAFAARFGVEFGSSDTTFEATAADDRSRRLLQLPPTVPILLMKSLLADRDGRPRELCYFNYPGNLVTVSVNPSASMAYERAAVALGEYEVATDLVDIANSDLCTAEQRLA
jgi:GntR family transcriptional regulator